MKQLFITILLLITSVGMLFGQFARGNGTESEPWQIETAEHLNNIRNYLRVTNNDKHFILMNDISLTEYLSESGAGYTAWNTLGWEPIGYYDSGTYQDIFFTGKFDDNKKKITGLKINRSEDGDIGLFGGLGSSAEIKNLGIEIQPESSVVWAVSVGGFMGTINSGTIAYCFWDVDTDNIAGNVSGDINYGAIGKTTIEMKQFDTYIYWDFSDIWSIDSLINNGYPYLLYHGFADGAGTSLYPYQIETIEHLNNIRYYLGDDSSGKHFKLMNDISLTDFLSEGGAGYAVWDTLGWEPIGTKTTQFLGTFDGNNKKIIGIEINREDTDNIGLFGYLGSGGVIKNLGVIITPEKSVFGFNNVGGLIGTSEGDVTNCYSTGKVIGFDYIGGLVRDNTGTITNCYSTSSENGYDNVGGLMEVIVTQSQIATLPAL